LGGSAGSSGSTVTTNNLGRQAQDRQLSLVELDEQPTLDGVLPAQAASAEARARARIFE